jgi:poly-gamma-glutamate synthesis protein (capsule biosynthesis protein)
MEANGAGYPYALVTHLLDGDLVVGNLEGALTERGEPWPKGYNFRTPPRFAPGLAGAGFDLVSLANNHAMDYGAIGVEDTMAALQSAGVAYAGAAAAGGPLPPSDAAYVPVVLEANGVRVAIIACALSPTEGGGFAITDWAAQPDATGIAICDPARITTQVVQARTMADFVVVYPHAGDEYVNTPNGAQRSIADAALGAGADAFVGHHAHVVQPIERRGQQLIAWGLGNFIFDLDEVDLANIPQPRVSLVLRVTFMKGAGVTSYEALPVVLDANEDRPRPATVDEAAALQSLIGG